MSTAQDILAGAQRWELLRKRRAKETLRSVFRVDDRYVAKQFEIPLAARRYRRPWLAEDACLRRLDGRGAPRSFGWFEETAGDRRVVWLVKEYVAGTPVETFSAADLPAAARLLAGVHGLAVFTDDASAGNFLRTPDGQMEFLDFGRARPYRRAGWRFDAAIGCELAKLRREGFRWDDALWRAFRPLYFEALGASRGRQIRIRLACAAAVALRRIRKTLQGKNPRS